MLHTKGRINKKGELVLRQGHGSNSDTVLNNDLPKSPSNIKIKLLVSIDLNELISGFDGFVWATKNLRQVEIICNAIKVQDIEFKTIEVESDDSTFHLIRVTNEKDVKSVIDFIQNDKSGLRLKPDWTYPEGETNQSFEQWLNH